MSIAQELREAKDFLIEEWRNTTILNKILFISIFVILPILAVF